MRDTERAWTAELAAHGLLAAGREPEHERALRLALRLCDASAGAVLFRDGGPRTALGEEAPSAAIALDTLAREVMETGAPIVTAPSAAWRFVAGVPLINTQGIVLGALCVLDQRPGPPPGGTARDAIREALLDLARIVMEQLEERRRALGEARLARDAQLLRRLMAVAAEAADLESSVRSAAQALCEATQALTCQLWQRHGGSELSARFLGGWSEPTFEVGPGAQRNQVVSVPNSPTLRAMSEGRQILVEDVTSEDQAGNPLLEAAAQRGLSALMVSPFHLESQGFALLIGLGAGRTDLAEVSHLLEQAVAALRPILRRLRDEEQARLLRRVVEASSDVVLITEAEPFDEPGPRIVYANPAFERETGYTLAEVTGRTPRLLQGPGTSAKARRNIRNALETWQPVRQAVLNYRKDGSTFWSDLRISPVADSEGRFTHWVSIQRDVTLEREAEIARAEALAERDSMLARLPGVLFRFERQADGRWLRRYASAQLEALTGFTPGEATQLGWFRAHAHPEDCDRVMALPDATIGQPESATEFRFRHKDGRWLWIRGIQRSQVNAAGVPELMSIWTDITREKQLAEQLAHSAKLAQLGEVTTGMAHELNQPLATISMAADIMLLQLDAADPALAPMRERLEKIIGQTGRMANLIDHMRIFGRAENLPPAPLDIPQVITAALEMLNSKLTLSSVEVVQEVEAGLPPVLGSAIPLEQVLMNLVANACDAYDAQSPDDGPGRRVRLRAVRDGTHVLMEVRDAAGGIAPEILPRIFEPFFTTKPVGQGTGLGLSISYGIIQDMGGSLTAENVPGGTAFRIRLPIA
ncbi:PAS domain S-box protein [Roseococcus sp. SDR]|uniref:PAS domain S-box protein n=1 Tax=Roseococcus sp. SDR TaxID=2835532 RepID=UPI001BCE7F1E|nr:PAS domain S-box protein [Roseococcus sp. SDR]MBS7790602.1 PAS domain S-box protein [Roseococcus sp. SDR]MBV1845916.1 PAS domain S-box protein [Roseococcus sp. SDR]